MRDLLCPRCGAPVEWGESTCVRGATAPASCLRHQPSTPKEERRDCRWRGRVCRTDVGLVLVETETEAEWHLRARDELAGERDMFEAWWRKEATENRDLRAQVAERQRFEASQHNLAAVVAWLRSEGPGSPADVWGDAVGGTEWSTAADAIEAGTHREGE